MRDAALLVERYRSHTGGEGRGNRGGISKKRRGHAGGEITPAWFLWYGMRVGLTMDETLDIHFGDLLTLIAVERLSERAAVKNES